MIMKMTFPWSITISVTRQMMIPPTLIQQTCPSSRSIIIMITKCNQDFNEKHNHWCYSYIHLCTKLRSLFCVSIVCSLWGSTLNTTNILLHLCTTECTWHDTKFKDNKMFLLMIKSKYVTNWSHVTHGTVHDCMTGQHYELELEGVWLNINCDF